MKVAVLADIHANFVALETVAADIDAWGPDLVIVGGDVVNRGPRPRACLDFVLGRVRRDGWRLVRGNHEDYVIYQSRTWAQHSPLQQACYRFSYWTARQLNGQLADLEGMPFQQTFQAPDGSEARVTHASMTSNRHGIFPRMPDEELRARIQPPPALLCVGHTHIPLQRRVDQTLVVNVGAVGLPFDGDTRASYGRLQWRDGNWAAEIVRLPYDLARAERDFEEAGFLEEGGPLAYLILDELQTARSHLYWWTQQYQDLVLTRQVGLAESVERFLHQCDG